MFPQGCWNVLGVPVSRVESYKIGPLSYFSSSSAVLNVTHYPYHSDEDHWVTVQEHIALLLETSNYLFKIRIMYIYTVHIHEMRFILALQNCIQSTYQFVFYLNTHG